MLVRKLLFPCVMKKEKASRKEKSAPARSDSANAFLPDPSEASGPVADDLAEYLGENFVAAATGSDDGGEILQQDLVAEELGGPFIETDDSAAFGSSGTEPDEPGEPEAFPTAVRGDKQAPSGGRR